MSEPVRRRVVRKMVSFTPEEWERVERRMEAARARTFDAFARGMLLEGTLKVVKVAFDASVLRVELSRIGNNLNQIARKVNVDDGATVEEMRAARLLLRQVQEVITRAARGGS